MFKHALLGCTAIVAMAMAVTGVNAEPLTEPFSVHGDVTGPGFPAGQVMLIEDDESSPLSVSARVHMATSDAGMPFSVMIDGVKNGNTVIEVHLHNIDNVDFEHEFGPPLVVLTAEDDLFIKGNGAMYRGKITTLSESWMYDRERDFFHTYEYNYVFDLFEDGVLSLDVHTANRPPLLGRFCTPVQFWADGMCSMKQ